MKKCNRRKSKHAGMSYVLYNRNCYILAAAAVQKLKEIKETVCITGHLSGKNFSSRSTVRNIVNIIMLAPEAFGPIDAKQVLDLLASVYYFHATKRVRRFALNGFNAIAKPVGYKIIPLRIKTFQIT